MFPREAYGDSPPPLDQSAYREPETSSGGGGKFVVVLIGLVAMAFIFQGKFVNAYEAVRLQTGDVSMATALVVTDSSGHGRSRVDASYAFLLEDDEYRGNIASKKSGDEIKVKYLESNPSINRPANANMPADVAFAGIGVFAVLVVLGFGNIPLFVKREVKQS